MGPTKSGHGVIRNMEISVTLKIVGKVDIPSDQPDAPINSKEQISDSFRVDIVALCWIASAEKSNVKSTGSPRETTESNSGSMRDDCRILEIEDV